MVDGIIQEVFNIAYQRSVSGNEHRNIKQLQQELIEKIKQELNDHQPCLVDGCILRERLIGDNE